MTDNKLSNSKKEEEEKKGIYFHFNISLFFNSQLHVSWRITPFGKFRMDEKSVTVIQMSLESFFELLNENVRSRK